MRGRRLRIIARGRELEFPGLALLSWSAVCGASGYALGLYAAGYMP